MIEDHKIRAFWHSKLSTIEPEILSELEIPESSKKFLAEIGLPFGTNVFDELGMQFIFGFGNNKLIKIEANNHIYYAIANDGGDICIESSTGNVVSMSDDSSYARYFINSDIRKLLIFIQLFLSNLFPRDGENSEQSALQILQRLENSFNDIDPYALSKDINWWSILLEELRFSMGEDEFED